MTAASTGRPARTDTVGMWGFLALSLVKIWFDRRWPGSWPSTLASYAYSTWFLAWFGARFWSGYQRRRPHWTAESWRRYARLVAMPVIALILLFGELYLFDMKGSRTLFGAPKSSLRTIWVLIDLALMAVGAIGLVMAIEWLRKGEPSEPFTRTRWFRRGGGSAIAN